MKLYAATTNYVSSVLGEFKKVSFPSRRDVAVHTGVVVAAIIVMVAFLAIVDGFLGILVKLVFTNA